MGRRRVDDLLHAILRAQRRSIVMRAKNMCCLHVSHCVLENVSFTEYLRVWNVAHRTMPDENNDECTVTNNANDEYYAEHNWHHISFWSVLVILVRYIDGTII